uniref:Uncharacterized protein n=1 Tax=Amphimedon queenslandica TaxID=400682 RepID=A0A1X7U681_AMPQE
PQGWAQKKLLKSWTLASLPSLLTKLSSPLTIISAVSSALRSSQKYQKHSSMLKMILAQP